MSQFLSLKRADKSEKFELASVSNKNCKIPIVWDKNDNNQDMKQKSYEDVLQKRKERFGEVSPPKPKYQKLNRQDMKQKSYEDVLKKRKERFGEVSPPKPKYQKLNRQMTNINTISVNDLAILKKRSERFGETVSTLVKKIEEKDRMRKRQARFSSKMATLPTSIDEKPNVEVSQHTPSPTVELFKTIDQIEAEERGKIKLEK